MPDLRLPAAVAITLALLAGCSPDAQQPSPTPPSSPETPGGAAVAPSPTDAGASPDAPSPDAPSANTPPDLDAVQLALEPVVELNAPIAMAHRSGDDQGLYFAEQGGRVVRVVDGDVQPVLDISDQTTASGERGLLGIDFSDDGNLLYVSYTNQNGDSRVAEYQMDGNRAATGTRRSVLEVVQPYSNHNGGNVVTGPDGLLYFGLGDGGSANDPHGHGQDRSTLLGSLLRIDPSGNGEPYRVPDDNPFIDAGDARPEIWAYGLRNPWRFSFDRETDDLWLADVGQDEIEEIDWLPFDQAAGANFGWNAFEGTQPFAGGPAPDDAVPPVHEYRHTPDRHTVIGGYVYRGRAIDGLNGAYLYSDLYDGVIRALVLDDGEVTAEREFDAQVPSIASFGEDARGELYALSLAGQVYRLGGLATGGHAYDHKSASAPMPTRGKEHTR